MQTTMFHYTNRKGTTYYLHCRANRGGSPRYTLNRNKEGALAELPPGLEVVENVNGQVSARQIRPRQITDAEEAIVRSGLVKHGLDAYRIEVKNGDLTIFAPGMDSAEVAAKLHPFKGLPAGIGAALEASVREQLGDAAVEEYLRDRESKVRKNLEKIMRYEPVLRFRLASRKTRLFDVARVTYRGQNGWHLLDEATIASGVKRYVPHLGKESFFELV